jgi:hypothetical protein
MLKSNIRTSLVARHISRKFFYSLGANAIGASHVSGLYLEQIVSRITIHENLQLLRQVYTPYSGQSCCFWRTNKRFLSFGVKGVLILYLA